MAHSENFTLVQPWNQLFNLVPKEDDGAFASVIGGLQTDSEGQAFSDAPLCQSFLPQGVAVLHQNDIIHYDLKCDNVMVEVNKKCLGLDAPCCFDVFWHVKHGAIFVESSNRFSTPLSCQTCQGQLLRAIPLGLPARLGRSFYAFHLFSANFAFV
jgi:hypothetical protein